MRRVSLFTVEVTFKDTPTNYSGQVSRVRRDTDNLTMIWESSKLLTLAKRNTETYEI